MEMTLQAVLRSATPFISQAYGSQRRAEGSQLQPSPLHRLISRPPFIPVCRNRGRKYERSKFCPARMSKSSAIIASNGDANGEKFPISDLSVPVYSLSTMPDGSGRPSMNILTYATPVAINPTRTFAISLYNHTLSRHNFFSRQEAVVQVLCQKHAPLVELLGKTGGWEVDKLGCLRERGWQLEERWGFQVLSDCASIIHLQFAHRVHCGDHDIAVCNVVKYATLNSQEPPLYTGYLREHGYI